MEKVINVIQTSICDWEVLVNVIPCASYETAKAIMEEEIGALLSEGRYSGLDLDEIEQAQKDEADCDYVLEREEDMFYLSCRYDNYSERIEIEEKEIQY